MNYDILCKIYKFCDIDTRRKLEKMYNISCKPNRLPKHSINIINPFNGRVFLNKYVLACFDNLGTRVFAVLVVYDNRYDVFNLEHNKWENVTHRFVQ